MGESKNTTLCKDGRYCCFRRGDACEILKEAPEPPCNFAKESYSNYPYEMQRKQEEGVPFIKKWPYA